MSDDRLKEIKKRCERVTVIRGWIRGSQNNLILSEDFPWLIAEVEKQRAITRRPDLDEKIESLESQLEKVKDKVWKCPDCGCPIKPDILHKYDVTSIKELQQKLTASEKERDTLVGRVRQGLAEIDRSFPDAT